MFYFCINFLKPQQIEQSIIFKCLAVVKLLVDILRHHRFVICNSNVYPIQVHLLCISGCIIKVRFKKNLFYMHTYPTKMFSCILKHFSITLEHFFKSFSISFRRVCIASSFLKDFLRFFDGILYNQWMYRCYNRITEWPGLEGTSRIVDRQPPCTCRATNLPI